MNVRAIALSFVAAAGLTALIAAPSANAAPITGALSISGPNTIDYAGNAITFTGPASVVASTGDFLAAGFNGAPGADPVTMRNVGSPILYTGAGPLTFNTGSDLACGAGCLFTASSGTGNTATFEIVNFNTNELDGLFVVLSGSGFASLTGSDKTAGIFILSTGLNGSSLSFQSTIAAIPVPGPLLGAGIPGLIAACGGLVFLARRRRNKIA